MMRFLIKIVIVLVLLAAAGGGIYYYMNSAKGEPVSFRTAAVKRGDLVAIINATGTVEPEEVVDVGAQVAGQINSFGKDTSGKQVDYGSVVDENTILAQIDDSLYAADVAQAKAAQDQAKAALDQANASVVRATADLGQMKAKLEQAQRDWDRAQKLGAGEALAQSAYDSYQSAFEVAKANLAVGDAAIVQANGAVVQAKAAVAQALAFLQRAQRNLSYCTIKSPVKGVIIDRRVNIGQTVVSSLNAPSLFLIAKDLTRMQVWVAVNEADIGQIHPGQPVTFTVDAFSGQTFRGEVIKTRLNASMTSNVVTYTVEVLTDNSSGKLLPYLTANVNFELDRRTGVLLVPNAALRWFPQPDQVAPEFRATLASYQRRAGEKSSGDATTRGGKPVAEAAAKGDEKSASGEPAAGEVTRPTPGVIWVLDGSLVRPIRVQAGLSDSTQTEVSGEGLSEGLEVVLSEQVRAAAATTTNPFTPQFRGGGSKSGGEGGGTSGGTSGGSGGRS
jgi:HlyD family secretion protein